MADVPLILVTGAGGFLGRHISRYFAGLCSVVGVSRESPENAPLPWLQAYKQLELPSPHFAEVLRLWRPTALIHCAGRASVPFSVESPLSDFTGNTTVLHNVLEDVRVAQPSCRLILLSSAAVYGNPEALPVSETSPLEPISPYGYHKLQCELACQEYAQVYGLRTVNLRLFSAYGEGLRRQVVWDICRKALSSSKLMLEGNPEDSRDFIHAHDVARAIDLVLRQAQFTGEAFNVASGRETSIKTLANRVLKELKRPIDVEFSVQSAPTVPRNWRADINRLSRLGFECSIQLSSGLRRVAAWARAELGDGSL